VMVVLPTCSAEASGGVKSGPPLGQEVAGSTHGHFGIVTFR
jgi:hypothetical protein